MNNLHKKTFNLYLLPLLLLILIQPLIMRVQPLESQFSKYTWYSDKAYHIDIFLYWKSIFIIVIVVAMLIVMFITKVKSANFAKTYGLKGNYWILCLLGYEILVLLSTILSHHRNYGFNGVNEQFESIWIIFGYGIIMLFTFFMIKNGDDVYYIVKSLVILSFILGIVGIFQFIGFDFFSTDIGKSIITPEKYSDLSKNIKAYFEGNMVYMTLYNPNYAGVFCAMLLAVVAALIYVTQSKIYKLVCGITLVLLVLCGYGTRSTAFLISCICSVFIAILFYAFNFNKFGTKLKLIILKHYKVSMSVFIMVLVLGAALVVYKIDVLSTDVENSRLQDIIVTDDNISFVFGDNALNTKFEFSDESIEFYFEDVNGTELKHEMQTDNMIHILDDRFRDIHFTIAQGEKAYTLVAMIKQPDTNEYMPFQFADTKEGYRYINIYGKEDAIEAAETAVFQNVPRLASGRGYIWSRSIPMLKDTLILGKGADSFVFEFPHNDYVGRFNADFYDVLVTKPHNLYLQIAIQYGCIAMICFMAICIIYLAQSFRIYFNINNDINHLKIIGFSIMISVITYLISGLVNDTSVTITPLFWILLGMGLKVNNLVRK